LRPGPGRSAAEVADHQRARVRRALVELSVEQGYDVVTLRELMARAGVSTRAFYLHYSGKEECFLEAHELIARRLLARLVASQAGTTHWKQRATLALRALIGELGHDPEAARIFLIEAHAAGPAAREQGRRASQSLEMGVGESFSRAPNGIEVPPLVIEGMLAGALGVARASLLSGRGEELPALGDQLAKWALAYASEAVAELAAIDSISVERRVGASNPGAPSGNLALLLSAATKLAAKDGCESLTVRRILRAAGTPRRSFYAHFESAEDCLAAALELQIDEALSSARRSRRSSTSWESGACRAIVTLGAEIADRPVLANIGSEWAVSRGSGRTPCHRRLVLEIARLITDGAPPTSRPSQRTAEASANAVLSVLRTHGTFTARPQVLRRAGTLAYLALAPTIGADRAIEVIREENVVAARG
jgi:AcrR family transcriptional regulator